MEYNNSMREPDLVNISKDFVTLQELLGREIVQLFFTISAFLMLVIGCFGVVANICSCIVLTRPALRKSPMTLLLLNLAVWDSLLILGAVYTSRSPEMFLSRIIFPSTFLLDHPVPAFLPYVRSYNVTG